MRRLLTLALLAWLVAAAATPALAQGEDFTLTDIDFEGNDHFDSDRLARFLSIKVDDSFTESDFDSTEFEEQFRKIVAFYVSEGFRSCRGNGMVLEYNSDATEAELTIRIIEGPHTVVDTIIVKGNTFFDREKVLESLVLAQGDRYERQLAANGRTALGGAYRTAGFLDARVEVVATWPDSTVRPSNNEKVIAAGASNGGTGGGSGGRSDGGTDGVGAPPRDPEAPEHCSITYTVTENTRYTIDSIRLEGLQTVKTKLVTREFKFHPGEYVDLEKISEAQRSLYETNLFRTVSLKPVPTEDTTAPRKNIQARFIEEDPGKLELSLGFGTVDKVRGGAVLTYDNTFGEGYRSSIGGKFSIIEQTVGASLENPWMFGPKYGTILSLTVSREDEPSYVLGTLRTDVNVYKKFLRRSRFSLIPSYELGRFSEFKYSIFEDSEFLANATPEEIALINTLITDLRIGYGRLGAKAQVQLDIRNDLLDPTGGIYVDASSEFIYGKMNLRYQGENALPAVNRLVSTEIIARTYQAADKTLTIATAIETGLIVELAEAPVNFLLDDLFYAGGPTSLRGFDYKLVGPLAPSGSPLGGKLKLIWNVIELRKRIVGIFGAVAFFDLGNVWSSAADFRWNDFRYSPGIGLRADSPIGVVRVDYGFNPWPRNDEPPGQFWFGIGHAF